MNALIVERDELVAAVLANALGESGIDSAIVRTGSDDQVGSDRARAASGVTGHRIRRSRVTAERAGRVLLLLFAPLSAVHAEQVRHDPNLPSVKPEALQQLSDTQIRQQIMQESQAKYRGRCVCPYQTRDANDRSCKGRHEIIRSQPQPICYPGQVTPAMVSDWRRQRTK
jgi:hypothetical protein